MIRPSTRLLAAIWLALGFVLFRIGYAIVFTGASAGTQLVDLPGIELAGIFSHVTLLGPIGIEGLVRVVASSIPFALAIIGFGILSFFVGPEKIGKFALASKSNSLRALGVGLSVLPAIAEAAGRIARGVSYRSAPKRYSLLPLLETAISRANAVSETLLNKAESIPQSDRVVIPVSAFSEHLELRPGDALLVTGVTGSGKTTLLRSIAARAQEPKRQLPVTVFGYDSQLQPRIAASFSRYVSQQPRESFIEHRLDSSTQLAWLSEGEAVKHAISLALQAEPKLLVLDEPFASLDQASCAELNRQLSEFRTHGGIVVVSEHETQRVELPGARRIDLGQRQSQATVERTQPIVGSEELIEFEGTRIFQAELIALTGSNGVGKTSFLKRLLVAAEKKKLAARFVPERVEDLFLTQSLAEEFELSDKLSKSKPGTTQSNFTSMLPITPELSATHPRDLSTGTKLVLGLSIALALRPRLLLIDEPVKGLDVSAREQMAEVLGCVQETGCAIVFATHDKAFAALANNRVELKGVSSWSGSAL